MRIVSFDGSLKWYKVDSRKLENGEQEVILLSFPWSHRSSKPPRKENSLEWDFEAAASEWKEPEEAVIELDMESSEVLALIQRSRNTGEPVDLGPSHHDGQLVVAYDRQYVSQGESGSGVQIHQQPKMRRSTTHLTYSFRPEKHCWDVESFCCGKLTSTPDPYGDEAQSTLKERLRPHRGQLQPRLLAMR